MTAVPKFTLPAGSTAYLEVTFLDKAGVAAVPGAVDYRIDCYNTGASVRATTSIAPAATVEITLTPTDNTLVSPAHATELRTVTVRAHYGADDQVVADYAYQLRRTNFS